jgi:hypothetical protein
MPQEQARGSSKMAPMSVEELQTAIGTAREDYRVTRWIKKGIPPVYDRVEALIEVSNPEKAGEIFQGIANLPSASRIALEVFPFGIPKIDGALLNVNIDLGMVQQNQL